MGNPKGVRRNFTELEQRRLRAAKYMTNGLSDAEIARRLRVSRESVRRWRKSWKAKGRSGLRKAGRAGRKPRLTEKQQQAVNAALAKGAVANGYASELWTLPRVAEVVEKLTGVRYHPHHVNRLLWALGWSCQKPKLVSRARDEDAIAEWREHTWKKLKKKPDKSGE